MLRRASTPLLALCCAAGAWAHARAGAITRRSAVESDSIRCMAGAMGGDFGRPPIIDFDRDIRPLLADRCFRCHGPDASRRKAGLRLDEEASAKSARKDGRVAIVPGDLGRSELWRRVNAHDDDRMPPANSGLSLSAAEIARLRAWIEQGAPYTEHWSLRSLPDAVPVPEAPGGEPANPIDAFVRARLEREGLAPAPPASKTQLLRRASFALTGLPPTPEELDVFAGDETPDAFARVLDRLLASPRYGERMAVPWLDAARYADTYGYQADVYREVWPWRDWVVDAFQRNLPFDQFLTWQLAGDLLPDASREQILATCFDRLHRQTNEGGSVEEEFRVEYVCDRVETLGSAVLGLTLGCARCHDHKFDRIKQREFYQLFALFDDIDECGLYSHFTNAVPTPTLLLPTPEQEKALAAAEAARQAAGRKAGRTHRDIDPVGLDEWLAQPGKRAEVVACAGHFAGEAIEGGKVANLADPSKPGRVDGAVQVVPGKVGSALRFDGECSVTLPGVADFTAYDEFTIAFWLKVDAITDRAVVLHRSRAWTDAGSRGYELLLEDGRPSFALIHFWPGNAVRIRAKAPLQAGRWTHVAIRSAGHGRADTLGIVVDGTAAEVEVVRDCLTKSITGGGAEALVVGARFRDRGLAGGEVDDLWVFPRCLTELEIDHLAGGSRLAQALARRSFHGEQGEQIHDELSGYYRSLHPDDLVADEAAYRKALAGITAVRDQIREIMVMRDDCPRAAYVLERGAYDRHGAAVEPDVPASLPPWPKDAPRNRLGLARWLCEPHHPLTARVAVNRIWQMHFGQGLVRTQEDFGVQGSPPSHPQLLDWLARRFVQSGWDVQALHRLILTSQTWQQSSVASAALRERDPDNELLARGPRLRLSAEMTRDAALFTAGLLVEKPGGPPVKPYQPPGLWEEKSGASYRRDVGEGSHRRSLYTFWKRTSPPPSMSLFDAPDREVCVQRRQRTITPLQALVLMNDPQFVEAARGLAERALRECGADVEASVRSMHLRVLGELPRPGAARALRALWDAQAARFAGAPEAARQLLAVGDPPHEDAALDLATQAAATMVASAIYSADEAVVLR
ncbi:MAG: DUF1553 domain-containing protein [Planctomycetota bacterium]